MASKPSSWKNVEKVDVKGVNSKTEFTFYRQPVVKVDDEWSGGVDFSHKQGQ